MDGSTTVNSPLVGRRRQKKTPSRRVVAAKRVVTVRMHADLHELLGQAAHADRTSINRLCLSAICSEIGQIAGDNPDRFTAADKQRLIELARGAAADVASRIRRQDAPLPRRPPRRHA